MKPRLGERLDRVKLIEFGLKTCHSKWVASMLGGVRCLGPMSSGIGPVEVVTCVHF